MPIEREFKFVLHSADELESYIIKNAKTLKPRVLDIRQGYLRPGTRVRSKTYKEIIENGALLELDTRYVFTYKHRLTSQAGALEIECDIDYGDFKLAWEESSNRILKTRYVIPWDGPGVWEIDFFRHKNKTYLAMAELEVPANQGSPAELHPLIDEYLMFAVPEADDRFGNRKLSDHKKVTALLKEIA